MLYFRWYYIEIIHLYLRLRLIFHQKSIVQIGLNKKLHYVVIAHIQNQESGINSMLPWMHLETKPPMNMNRMQAYSWYILLKKKKNLQRNNRKRNSVRIQRIIWCKNKSKFAHHLELPYKKKPLAFTAFE